MPTEQSTVNGRTTGNGRKSKRRANSRLAVQAGSDVLDTDHLLAVLTAVRKGDFSLKMPVSQVGVAGKISDALNDIIDLNRETAREFERVSQAVGKEGKITQRAHLHGAAGAWAASVNSVNTLIGDLVQPTSEVARVIGAVARGDLSQSMSLDIEGRPLMGEFLRIGKTVNSMVDQLSSFASEVTRVAREVGAAGRDRSGGRGAGGGDGLGGRRRPDPRHVLVVDPPDDADRLELGQRPDRLAQRDPEPRGDPIDRPHGRGVGEDLRDRADVRLVVRAHVTSSIECRSDASPGSRVPGTLHALFVARSSM